MALKLLSIGNSFSQDAHRYIPELAAANGIDIEINNLYIGGCSLKRHCSNMINENSREYSLEEGKNLGIRPISLKEALSLKAWDIVSLQQASHESFDFANYVPYITELADYVRKNVNGVRLAIHKTWMYEEKSEKLLNVGFESSDEMYERLSEAYILAKDKVNAEIMIPAGATLHKLAGLGYKVHRDGFHASFGLGRYAIALTWLRALFGRAVKALPIETDEPISSDELADIDRCVNEALVEIGL